MGQGKRMNCGNCYSVIDFDYVLQYCRKCGWKADDKQTTLKGD